MSTLANKIRNKMHIIKNKFNHILVVVLYNNMEWQSRAVWKFQQTDTYEGLEN